MDDENHFAFSKELHFYDNVKKENYFLWPMPGLTKPLRVSFWDSLKSSGYDEIYSFPAHVLNEEETEFVESGMMDVLEEHSKPEGKLLSDTHRTILLKGKLESLISEKKWKRINGVLCYLKTDRLIKYIDDDRPWPRPEILYTKEGKNYDIRKQRELQEQFDNNLFKYVHHRVLFFRQALYYLGIPQKQFWIDLWDPHLLRCCEDPNLDYHPRAVLVRNWERKREQQKVDERLYWERLSEDAVGEEERKEKKVKREE